MKKGWLCFTFLFTTFGFAAEWQQDTVLVFHGQNSIQLSNPYVIPESVTLRMMNSTLVDSDSIQVDALRGTIQFFSHISDSLRIIVGYQYLDMILPQSFIINPPPRIYIPEEKPSSVAKPVSESESSVQTVSYDFLKSGSLYRGVTMGSNRGIALKSGLNLELDGRISEDISIIGALTDQNIPIQPEGNTQTLEEIDKVYIQVRMPFERFTFGDYQLVLENGELGSYRRKFQGVYFESQRKAVRTEAGGAITKGQFQSYNLVGEESNQGPYQLLGKAGETAIIILAGTERVWINGELKQRGENLYYVIDYATAEITFTPRCLITSDSRITVDFQYSNLIYPRNLWLARSQVDLYDQKLTISVSVLNEADDRDNPIELTLTEDDISQMRAAGDCENAAFQSTIKADSSGAYILVDSVLKFVGAGFGDHSASFYNIGQIGNYKKIYTADLVYFEYVDKHNPDLAAAEREQAVYAPLKPLRLPKSQRIYHFNSEWQATQNFTISSEMAVSDYDQNTFSEIKDEDNLGIAYLVKTQWRIPQTRFGKFSISGKFRHDDVQFRPIDRSQAVEYRRYWDLASDSTQGQQLLEGEILYEFHDQLKASAELGHFENSEVKSQRYRLGTSCHFRCLNKSDIYTEHILRNSNTGEVVDWIRDRAFLQFKFLGVLPYFNFYQEQKSGASIESDNFRFSEQTIGLKSNEKNQLRWQIESHWRKDNEWDASDWQRTSSAFDLKVTGQVVNWRSFSAQWDYVRRIKKYFETSGSPNVDFNLLSFWIKHNPRQFSVTWESTMKIEESRTVKKEWRYFKVGLGEGQYSYDSTYADYVPHPQGDYILRVIPTDIKEPVTNIQNGIRLQFSGNRIRSAVFAKLFKQVLLTTDIRLQQQIKALQSALHLWTSNPDRVDGRWALFSRILRQDLNYRLSRSSGLLRLRYYLSTNISQLDVRGQEENYVSEWSLQYRGRFIRALQLETELILSELQRKSGFNINRNRNINSRRFENKVSYNVGTLHYFSLNFNIGQDIQNIGSKVQSQLFQLRGNYERKVLQKGKWINFVEANTVKVTPAGRAIPWEMSKGKKEGLTLGWGTSLEYRIGRFFNIRINYEGWQEPDRDLYHLGGAEVRAYF